MAVKAEFQLGIRGFQNNLKRASNDVRREAKVMKSEGAGVGRAFASSFKGAASSALGGVGSFLALDQLFTQAREAGAEARQMLNISSSVNESVEALSRLKFATGALGLDFEAASELSRELEDRLGDLGNTEPAEVLKRMGLEIENLIGQPIDQKVLMLAEAFQKSRAEGVGYSDLLKLLGDSVGEQLLPLLTQTREELEKTFAQAPDDIANTIQQMAMFDRKLNEIGESAKAFRTDYFGSIAAVGQFLGDVITTGSLDKAFEKEGERQLKFQQDLAEEQRANEAKARAISAARESEASAVNDAKAADDLAKALEKVAAIKEKLADAEIDMLPDSDRINALKEKLNETLSSTAGNFSLNFAESIEGLADLAKSREGDATLPMTGANSALEAFQWLEEAKEIQREIEKLEKAQAEKQTATMEKKQSELESAREKADSGAFALMDPKAQAAHLREQLSQSLGIDIEKAADIEKGLDRLRSEAAKAREQGDVDAEKKALAQLADAQEQSIELQRMADSLPSTDPGGPVGEFGQLFNQIFGRDPQERQAESLRNLETQARDQVGRLDLILTKMDEPPPRDIFSDFDN